MPKTSVSARDPAAWTRSAVCGQMLESTSTKTGTCEAYFARIADAPAIPAKYASHVPVFVEVDSSIWPQTADLVHAAGSRALTDVFGIDLGVKLGSDPGNYLTVYTQGAD